MSVGVVIAAHNAEAYILDAVNSILSQDYNAIKLVVVDDGSEDHTFEKLQSVKDERLLLHKLPVNCGIATARNIGARLVSDCDYIAVMDADDIALAHRISTQVKFLDANPKIHVLGSRIKIFHDKPDEIVLEPKHPHHDAVIKARLLLLNGTALIHPSTLMRNSFLKANHLAYPPPTRGTLGIDHDFWISMIPYGVAFHALEEVLLLKRRHSHNVSKRSPEGGHLAHLKTVSRLRLLSYYYPQLNRHELRHLAILLEEQKALSFEEMSLAYASLNQIKTLTMSSYGESKNYLLQIFQEALQRKKGMLK